MADSSKDAYRIDESAASSIGRGLLDRARAQPRTLLRKLAIGDAIGERPEITLPRDQRRRK